MPGQARNWNFLVYPDSAPSNWLDILTASHLPIALSLHDSDDDGKGGILKPHYHGIVRYPNTTTFKNVSRLMQSVNSPFPIQCVDLYGSYQYLTHANAPDKFQYKSDDIILLNGFQPINAPNTGEYKSQLRRDITQHIIDNGIISFGSLVYYALQNPDLNWLDSIARDSYYYTRIISSIAFEYNCNDSR